MNGLWGEVLRRWLDLGSSGLPPPSVRELPAHLLRDIGLGDIAPEALARGQVRPANEGSRHLGGAWGGPDPRAEVRSLADYIRYRERCT